MILVLLFAMQVATDAVGDAVPPPVPQTFSVMADATPPCRRAPGSLDDGSDIIVCAPSDLQQRLLLRDERGPPDGPAPSNPDRTGMAALAGPPCAINGCQVGFGQPIAAAVLKGAASLARRAFAKKVDRTGRVPIDLGDPTPSDVAARVLP